MVVAAVGREGGWCGAVVALVVVVFFPLVGQSGLEMSLDSCCIGISHIKALADVPESSMCPTVSGAWQSYRRGLTAHQAQARRHNRRAVAVDQQPEMRADGWVEMGTSISSTAMQGERHGQACS